MVSRGGLNDSESPQVSRTLLCILADLNMLLFGWSRFVLRFPDLSTPLPTPLETVPIVPITIGITVTSGSNSLYSKFLFFFIHFFVDYH